MELGLLMGTGWAAGVNLYAVVALLGLAGRLDWLDVPGALGHPAVLALAVGMYAVEFVADKVPYLDNLWDVAHTVVRPVGAALLAVAFVGLERDASALLQGSAAVGSGALALASHAVKATARLALNSSPEPVTNIGTSLVEDSLVATVVFLAITNPALAVAAVVLLLVAGTAVLVLTVRAARAALKSLRERRARGSLRPPGQSRPGIW